MSRLRQNVNRRSVLKAGALVVAFSLAGAKVVSARVLDRDGADGDAPAAKAIGGFVRIEAAGRIVLVMPSVEMGQGIYTAEAVLLAEELDVGLDQVDLVAAPSDALLYAQPLFKAQLTGGSTSIRGFWTPLRQAGATARAMLVAAAAARWSVPPETCSTDRATVRHEASGRSLSYGELAGDAAIGPTPANVPLKGADQWKLIGQSTKRLDTPQKVNGQAVFGIDVVVPGMKIAAVTMCPVDGGRIASLDDRATRRLQGVRDVLRLEDAVAVVGDTYWTAKTGLDALLIEWDHGPNAAVSSETMHSAQVQASSSGKPIAGLLLGDVESAFTAARKRVEAVYELPFLAHATMEPINTTVHVRPDGCDIWVGTQTPVVAQTHAARIVGLPKDKVRIHNHLIGGGFGRRLQADTIEQAVAFARQVDYPVKFIWTREQDIRHDRFRPSYYDRIAAGLGSDGLPVAWTHRVTSGTVRQYFDEGGWPQGKLDKDAVDGAWDTPYDLPAIRVDWVRHDPPVKLNWWRGVGPTHNTFVVESFMDELAHEAGRDPVAYRQALLGKEPRSLAVLDLAAMKAGWGTPLPPRSGRGISLHKNFDTRAALVVEVAVDEAGSIQLRRIVAAVDCGIQVNPDTIRAQIHGGVIFGLSAALYNGITFAEGCVQQGNFNDYRQMRINEIPPFEVHLITSEASPGGLGEVGTVSAAPALANAIFTATGVRLRRLPIDSAMLAARTN
jgi:isoquinoline 1-oxidoreductase beta subunit